MSQNATTYYYEDMAHYVTETKIKQKCKQLVWNNKNTEKM